MQRLISCAREAMSYAYAPYSNFKVGAAVETANSDAIFSGCNVENASFGLTVCAERIAVFKAISTGQTQLGRLAVMTESDELVTPCGACRQVLLEFGVKEIIVCSLSGENRVFSMDELLPYAFGPADLEKSGEKS